MAPASVSDVSFGVALGVRRPGCLTSDRRQEIGYPKDARPLVEVFLIQMRLLDLKHFQGILQLLPQYVEA